MKREGLTMDYYTHFFKLFREHNEYKTLKNLYNTLLPTVSENMVAALAMRKAYDDRMRAVLELE